eukprot:XP_011614532.1 PREDICTED: C-C motif chemokine 24-like [Takifugu rubripes]
MRVSALFFLTVTACICLTLAQVTYDDCCMKYAKKMRPKMQKHVINYRWQVPDGGCNLLAVIFTTSKGRIRCSDPKEKWVTDLMRDVDQKKLKRRSKTVRVSGSFP